MPRREYLISQRRPGSAQVLRAEAHGMRTDRSWQNEDSKFAAASDLAFAALGCCSVPQLLGGAFRQRASAPVRENAAMIQARVTHGCSYQMSGLALSTPVARERVFFDRDAPQSALCA